MTDSAQGGDDILTATDSGDGSYAYLYGDAGYMINNSIGGNDILNGGVGNATSTAMPNSISRPRRSPGTPTP
jgi:hypothetical protein